MRTIKLTHEQIQLLCQALGIAENQFSNIHKTIFENTINARCENYGLKQEQTNNANFYHEMACKLADLNIDIQQGVFDV